jgi:hypothetical protein
MRAARLNFTDDTPVDKEALKQRMKALQSELASINKQLDELEEGNENDSM